MRTCHIHRYGDPAQLHLGEVIEIGAQVSAFRVGEGVAARVARGDAEAFAALESGRTQGKLVVRLAR